MGDNPYQDDHGNKDLSLGNPKGAGTLDTTAKSGKTHPAPGEPFLIGSHMTGGYGKSGPDILHDCTIAVEKGEIAVIVGPNGAGKSTAMKATFGMLNLREGHVILDGEDITKLTPQARVGKGMGFVPQTSNIFTSMSVEENLEMGAFIRTDDFRSTMEQVYELFPILREKRHQAAGEL
jgi:branched-chain amino acid transport system ATP-binding protein